MNLLKSPLHRTAAALAGAFLGMAGVVAVAAPASAHWPSVSGVSDCVNENESWTINWTVTNTWWKNDAKIHKLRGGPLTGDIAVGKDIKASEFVVGSQTVTAKDTGWVELKVELLWDDGHQEEAKNGVKKPTKRCAPPPSAPPSSQPPVSTPPSSEPPVSTPPSSQPPVSTPPSSTPPSSAPASSAPASNPPVSTPPPTAPASEPLPILEFTCNSLTIGLDNPEDGETVSAIFEPSTGESKTIVVEPGEREVVTFPASEGFTVKAIPVGFEDQAETIAWESPEDCDGGQGGGLPVTGAAAGSIAGGAAVLLGLGGGLFLAARRRRVKFTA